MKSQNQEISIILCRADDQHPRRDMASILAFDDGRLLCAYGECYAGVEGDEGPAHIQGRWSHDDGMTWSDSFLIQKNIGKVCTIEPSLLRPPSGRILLSFIRVDRSHLEPGGNGIVQMVRWSDDDCRTWSKPIELNEMCSDEVCNDRLIRLSSGRIILPGSTVFFSDDDGVTWKHSKEDGGCEPSAAELADGSLLKLSRSGSASTDFRLTPTRSRDGGETWYTDELDWGPRSSNAPCILRRVPNSDDLLLIWCNNTERTDLSSALSHDGGRSWVNFRNLEPSEGWPLLRSHQYPSLTFSRGFAHLTYREAHRHPNAREAAFSNARGEPHKVQWLIHLVYRRLPIEWFYAPPWQFADTPRRKPLYDLNKLTNDFFFPAEEAGKRSIKKATYTG